jgi:hypothetical protein
LPSAPPVRRPSAPPIYPAASDIDLRTRRQLENRPTHPRLRWGARNTRRVQLDEVDENELALQRRKWIYKHKLYAKVPKIPLFTLLRTVAVCFAQHVASNAYTRYQSFTPQQFANSADRKSRVVKFARREVRSVPVNFRSPAVECHAQLQVFPNVDVEWLVTYLLQIMYIAPDSALQRLLRIYTGAS